MALSDSDRRKVLSLIDELECAFVWKETPQGHNYWQSVVDELQNLL